MKKSPTVRHTVAVLAALSALTWLAGPSDAQFALYDNFASGFIDPELWEGVSLEGSFSAPTAEFIRAVENSALHLALVSWGNDTTDSGNTVSRQGLQIRQLGTLGGSGSITGMKAKVTVHDAVVQDCPANLDTAIRARAQVNGWYFNDGTSTGSTDDTGNIVAGIQLSKEADGSNQVQAFVLRCTNATCSTTATPPGITQPTFATTWGPDTPLVLVVIWDQANGKFKFQVTNPATAAVETHNVVYQGIVTNASPPVNGDFKAFRVQNNVKNCSTGRKQVMIDAFFDNVNVKRTP